MPIFSILENDCIVHKILICSIKSVVYLSWPGKRLPEYIKQAWGSQTTTQHSWRLGRGPWTCLWRKGLRLGTSARLSTFICFIYLVFHQRLTWIKSSTVEKEFVSHRTSFNSNKGINQFTCGRQTCVLASSLRSKRSLGTKQGLCGS